jgi:hypothetical protein
MIYRRESGTSSEDLLAGCAEDSGLGDYLVGTFVQDQVLDSFAGPVMPSHYDFLAHVLDSQPDATSGEALFLVQHRFNFC